jgi:hypothetical protein
MEYSIRRNEGALKVRPIWLSASKPRGRMKNAGGGKIAELS